MTVALTNVNHPRPVSTHYLVQFGKPGFVGCFRADAEHERGECVVIQGPRGVEWGTVLCEPAARFQHHETDDGVILRSLTPEDRHAITRVAERGQAILAAAEDSTLPLAFVDVEVMLDGTAAILHALPWDACEADPLFAELSDRFGLAVRMLDLSRTSTMKEEAPTKGCGKPGCGSEGGGCSSCSSGGCSTGSCSSGKVKNAGELTTYFADLRQKMEASRTPLV